MSSKKRNDDRRLARWGKSYRWDLYYTKTELLSRDPSCGYCGRTLTKFSATLDHMVPVCLGGGDDPGNLALACVDCNIRKGGMLPLQFVLVRIATS